MRKIASMKLDVIDYLLNKDASYVSSVVNRAGELAKVAKIKDLEEQQDLDDSQVAAILFHPHLGTINKYACDTKGSTLINMHILSDNHEDLPDELVKVAAGNLTYVADKYNLDIPSNLKEYKTDSWTDNVVDLTRINKVAFSQKLDAKTLQKTAGVEKFALARTKKFPISDKNHVKLAASVFENAGVDMSVEDRVEFSSNILPEMSKHNIPLGSRLYKYSNLDTTGFNDDFELSMDARIDHIHDEDLKDVYSQLKGSYQDLGVQKTAVLVDELDKRASIKSNYSKGYFDDAVLTTFKMRKVAEIDIDGTIVNEDDLEGLDHTAMGDYIDSGTLDELHGEDGLHILKSLPKPIRDQAISNITG